MGWAVKNKFDDRINELTGYAMLRLGAGDTLKSIVTDCFQSGMHWMKNKEYEISSDKEERK